MNRNIKTFLYYKTKQKKEGTQVHTKHSDFLCNDCQEHDFYFQYVNLFIYIFVLYFFFIIFTIPSCIRVVGLIIHFYVKVDIECVSLAEIYSYIHDKDWNYEI